MTATGQQPENEMRAAYEESKRLPDCRFVLGDRPPQVTLRRMWPPMSMLEYGRMFARYRRSDIADPHFRMGKLRTVWNALW